MAQNWDYAILSKAAKAAGGPEKYIEMLMHGSRNSGKMEVIKQMPIFLGAAFIGGSIITAVTIKLVDYLKTKNQPNEIAIEKAKLELINGIHDYDAAHEEE